MPTQHQVTGRLGQGIPTRSLTDRAPTLLITADAQKVPIYLDDTYTLKLTPQVFSIGELGDYRVGNAEDDRTWDPPSYSVSSPLEEDTAVNFVELAPITINATDGATPTPEILTVPMSGITIDYYDSPDTGLTGKDPDLLIRNFKKETSFSITAPDTLIEATPPNAGGFIKWVDESGATITTDNTLSQVAHAKATITAIYETVVPTITIKDDLGNDIASLSFEYYPGTPTEPKAYNVSGIGIVSDISITPDNENIEISFDSNTWVTYGGYPLVIPKEDVTSGSVIVYARYTD